MEPLQFAEFELDIERLELRRSGTLLPLERQAMELLILFAERQGELITRGEIVKRLWNLTVTHDAKDAVNTAIRKIRRVLGDTVASPRFLRTVTGKGYRFVGIDNLASAQALGRPLSSPQFAKLTPPRLPATVPRQRLHSLLGLYRERKVTWVSGPPGSGKTTLVSSYLESEKARCIWYQVDAGDGDPGSFFYYLREATRHAGKPPLPLLTSEYLPDLSGFTRRYFRGLIERLPQPTVLVFDNFQEAPESSPLGAILRDAAEEFGAGASLIVISQREPPAEFARLAANRTLALIGWDELRLTENESAEIVSLRNPRLASIATSAHERTGGWAAGMTLVLEHSARSETTRAATIDRPQALFDYFASEIFARAPNATQRVWLSTAYLPRFTGAVAQRLSDESSANRLLDALARRRYFIDRHYAQYVHYQYHALFREFLHHLLEQTYSPAERRQLAFRSAQVLEETGEFETAVMLYHQAENWGEGARLLLDRAPLLFAQGRWQTLQACLLQQPRQSIEEMPWLQYWIGACQGQTDPVASRAIAEMTYPRFVQSRDIVGQALSACAVIESYFVQQSDFTGCDLWVDVLERLVTDQTPLPSLAIELRVWSVFLLALANFKPQHPLVAQCVERVSQLCRADIGVGERLTAAAALVTFLGWTADAAQAKAVVNEFEYLAALPETTPLQRCTWLSSKSYSTASGGDMSKWGLAWRTARQTAAENGLHFMPPYCRRFEIWEPLVEGRLNEAAASLQIMEGHINRARPGDIAHHHYLRSWLALLQEQPRTALEHAEKSVPVTRRIGGSVRVVMVLTAYAQALSECGRTDDALAIAQEASAWFGERSDGIVRLTALACEADILRRMGRHEAFIETLREAFATGRRGGHFNTGTWLPKMMGRLAEAALEAGIETEYAQRLVRLRNLTPESPEVEHWPWPIRIYTLGRFALVIQDQELKSHGKAQKKPLELLKAMLAFSGGGAAQGELAGRLWPDLDGDAARNAFDLALYRLRKLLARPDVVRLEDGWLSLDSRYVWVDNWAFERLCGRVDQFRVGSHLGRELETTAQRLLRLHLGHFLAAEESPWAMGARERLRSKFLRGIATLGNRLEHEGQWDAVRALYQRGIELDALAEEFHCGLMRSFQAQGRMAEALDAYRRCRSLLSSNLGVEPSAATQALYRSLKSH